MIYFAQTNDNQYIKIGYAKDAAKRLEGLQTGNHIGVKLIGSMPGDVPLERTIHERFDHLRARREWFHAAPDLTRFALHGAKLSGRMLDTDKFLRFAVFAPELIDLFVEASSTIDDGDPDGFCANDVFFRYRNPRAGLKWRLSKYVGWYARDRPRLLQTQEAYDTVYERIYEALPNCRRCMCAGGGL
jgi:hypothetical protein